MYGYDAVGMQATRQADWDREVRGMQLSRQALESKVAKRRAAQTGFSVNLAALAHLPRRALVAMHARSA